MTADANNKIYVGNIHYDVTDDILRKVFEEVGTVTSCQIIRDRMTSQSKGFAFVEMETPELASEALEKLNGRDVSGRQLKLAMATGQKREGGGRPRSGGGFRGSRGPRGGDDFGGRGF